MHKKLCTPLINKILYFYKNSKLYFGIDFAVLSDEIAQIELGAKQPMQPNPVFLDVEILAQTIQKVEAYFFELRKRPDSDKLALIAALLYERFMREGRKIDEKAINTYLKLVS